MALFLVRHQHDAERCPAKDPDAGAALLNHLSRPNMRRQQVEMFGEAVVQGQHTLYLILQSERSDRIREFMQPFEAAGSVDIFPASTCAGVVAAGGCTTLTAGGALVGREVDPEQACQTALDAGLVVHRAYPLNGETSLQALIGGVVMPNAHFYVRNHFQIPALDPVDWRLRIGGMVERPLTLSMRDLHNLPSQSVMVTLECAGNGRSGLVPKVQGEQWQLGAVSTAEWTGVPLTEVLDRVGVRSEGHEVVFKGADSGKVEGRTDATHFERSLSVDQLNGSEALLAYAMNGEPLPIQHGFPLRLIVPGWYGVASVKWLTDIQVVGEPFVGFFQAERYFYELNEGGRLHREPVTLQRVRSLITEPEPDEVLRCGDVAVRGVAWSGAAPIERVEVSFGGEPWHEARLVGDRTRHSWQWWERIVRVDHPGPTTIRCRATDLAGRTQPELSEWNRLGYGANAIHEVAVRIHGNDDC
jgi:DMSO/TMAO reductase YedYZ molybdopterin-dependent catalytic subunit